MTKPSSQRSRRTGGASAKPARSNRASAAKPRAKAGAKAGAKAAAKPRARRAAAPKAAAPRAPKAPTGAQALVAQLEALGVDVVFGIPGVHNLAIFDALRGSSIRTVLVRHEQTAVYAADGYARATGRLGVGITTTGPGAANTAGAMGEALASRTPLLHISTQVESKILSGRSGRFSLHESPGQRDLMASVSVWSATVARAEAIPSMLQRAATEARAGRGGPAFVEIPHDMLAQPCTWKPGPPVREPVLPIDERAVSRAVSVLGAAKRPIVWAGGGAVRSGAGEELVKIAEALDAPIVTTFAGKGVAGVHPLVVGLPPHQPQVTKMLQGADAMLIVGSDLDAMNTMGWRLPLPRPRVSINTMHEDARRNYAADVVIEHDARPALEAILASLTPAGRSTAAKRVSTARNAAMAALRRSAEFADPISFVGVLEDAVEDGTIVVADMAIPGYWAAAYFRAAGPRAFQYPLGWGTLGYALPAAVGAASSGRPALAIVGDAGLLFGVGELATLAQENLPVVVLVGNDEGYGMLRFDEQERFGATFDADLHAPDHVALARSFGIKARRTTLDGLDASLRWAFKKGEPTLIELPVRFAPPLTTSPRWPLKGKPEARP